VTTVRHYKMSDLPIVLQIERAAFGADGYSASTFLAHAFRDRRGFFVAEDEEGQVVGYVLARMGLPWIASHKGGITSLAVAPCQRRRGIGRSLMCHALSYLRARQARQADLEVNVVNRAAQSLYESLGFRTSKLLRHYYGANKDGLQMILDLAANPAACGDPHEAS
jgi:ribosomal-protein-alanine acetyltransferase